MEIVEKAPQHYTYTVLDPEILIDQALRIDRAYLPEGVPEQWLTTKAMGQEIYFYKHAADSNFIDSSFKEGAYEQALQQETAQLFDLADRAKLPWHVARYYDTNEPFQAWKAQRGTLSESEQKQANEDFLLQHATEMQTRAQELAPTVEKLRHDFLLGYDALVAQGLFPAMPEYKRKLIENIPIKLTDSPNLDRPDVLEMGSFNPVTLKIELSLFTPLEIIEEVITHELTHAASGMMFQDTQDRFGSISEGNVRTGIVLFGKEQANSINGVNEALTEVASQLIINGGNIAAAFKGRIYRRERRELRRTLAGDDAAVLKQWIDAYFADNTPDQPEASSECLSRAVAATKEAVEARRNRKRGRTAATSLVAVGLISAAAGTIVKRTRR